MTGGLKVCLSEFCVECECTIVKNFVKLKMFEDFKDLVSNIATVVTIVNFLTGSQVCYEFYKKGNTGAASCASFLVGVMMTFSWYSYGVLRSDHSIWLVNGIGLGRLSNNDCPKYPPKDCFCLISRGYKNTY